MCGRPHQTFLAVALLAIVTAGAGFASPELRLRALVALGHSPYCPEESALRTGGDFSRLAGKLDSMNASTRLLESDGNYHLWQTPAGRFWTPSSKPYGLTFNLAEQAVDLYGTAEEGGVRPGDIVLDGGANVGVFTRKALASGAQLVIAIEPAPQNVESLRRNFADEIASGRVIVYPKGVWDRSGTLTLNVDPENSAAASLLHAPEGEHESIPVPLVPVDQLVAELGLPRVDLIKLDIEGAEMHALHGADKTLRTHRPRLAITVITSRTTRPRWRSSSAN